MTKIENWNIENELCYICVAESDYTKFDIQKVIWDYDVEGNKTGICEKHLEQLLEKLKEDDNDEISN